MGGSVPAGPVYRWTENRATGGARALRLRELWEYRELVGFLALRDLKARYKQAVFGVGWALLQPIATVAVFAVVFHRIADVPSEGLPYLLFALVGVSVWTYFSSSVESATNSLVEDSALVTKVYFPRLAAPVAALAHSLVGLVISLLLLGGLMAYYGIAPGVQFLAFPLCVLALFAVSLGAGVLLATLHVKYRDVHHAFGFLVQLWLFASPVGYPSRLVEQPWRWVYYLNPMAGVIDGFRWTLLAVPLQPEVAVSAVSGLALLTAGLLYFQRSERQFADVI